MKLTYKVIDNYTTVKQIIKNEFHISKRLLIKLKQNNRITKNNESVYINEPVKIGDIIEVDLSFEEESENIIATNISINIIYEDDAYIVINKQPKIETHPTVANFENTLANGVKYYFQQNNINKKIRPVNRLDKETSGIIIFAKNEYIQEQLIHQMKNGVFEKEYLAIVEGKLEQQKGTINAPIKRKEGSILERCVSADGQNAITEYEVLQTRAQYTLLRCKLKTGRTHQIRVHMSYIGHPIVSDFLYGSRNTKIDRQALHSEKIKFIHPITKEYVCYTCDLPQDMKTVIRRRKWSN